MSDPRAVYEQVCDHVRKTTLFRSLDELMGWDERVNLPPAAGDYRAEQMTALAGLVHGRWTDPRFVSLLNELASSELAADAESDTAVTIRELKRDVDRRTKLPQRLVEELARLGVLGQQAWQSARAKNDWESFRPPLERIVKLKQEEAQALGFAESPYDALLDEFEPGELTSNVSRVLEGLRDDLVPLVAAIRESGREPDISLLTREYPIPVQEQFGRTAAAKIGFEFERGRLDVTAHPFCSTLGPHDHRLTTRYDTHQFNEGFFGILHEAGHGIYEQGLSPDHYGFPLGEATSLGIHESQSRMWENFVGRSRAFWDYFYPQAQAAFPAALGGVRLDDFFFAVNDVRPSLIRVEADEATYNLHILVRFELEQALIAGTLEVADLPEAWNQKYRDYLGL